MNTKIVLLTCLCACIFLSAKSQTISRLNFDPIKGYLSQSGNYQQLIDRLNQGDTTLNHDNYINIYYGQLLQQNYAPYFDENKSLTEIQKLVQSGNLDGASDTLSEFLKSHPVSLGGIYTKIVIYAEKNNRLEKKRWTTIYRGLIDAITASGDGKTDPSAMLVVHISDEYKVLPAFGVSSIGHEVLASHFDKQLLKQPNRDGLTELHFNVLTTMPGDKN